MLLSYLILNGHCCSMVVVGSSMGGGGVWSDQQGMPARYAGRFAA